MKNGQEVIYTEKKFFLSVAVAAAMHILVIAGAVFFQIWQVRQPLKPKIVTVTFVSLHASGASADLSPKKSGAEKLPAPLPPSPPAPAPLPQPLLKPVPKPIVQESTPVKKRVVEEIPVSKTADKPEPMQKTLERLQQSVAKKTASSSTPSSGTLNTALSRLQQKVQSEGGGGGQSGARGLGPAGTYKAAIASIIQEQWEFSGRMLKNREGMEVYVRINISSDGKIRQIIFDRKAVSQYLNNSVKKALEKSSPLPVPPKELLSSDLWVGFVFTPEGIGQ